ncbi:tripartite tricarboxylate transporter TctB family protein [Maritimibacter alkaliphilus]|uniref:tripartite tricarboxylate transporter TctB family protein n=1 Tax=Maritimibacter alkaliphilus TaxID=404236 RepID=UPI001C9392BF|nr:tripartite tricarboxylate transporter TctB family protein [Maritimibacter alkaliphilus]MBY6091844.1 tripartite tricarboxylate transporter TctB family protein [Maritimibacter alkaliphilus]
MTEARQNRLLRPETLTAIGLIVAATGFLIPTFDLRPISALLPAAMLIGLIVLSALLLVSDQRKAAAGEVAKPVSTAPGRVIGAFALIVGYAVATDLLGFYPSTVVIIPLVSAIFGYRSPLGLVIATAIVVGSIWLIFDFGMSQDFPAGRLWQD